jgi:hypothetical protein
VLCGRDEKQTEEDSFLVLIEIILRRDHLSRLSWEGITYRDYPEKGSLIEIILRKDHLSRLSWEGIIYRDYPEKGSLIEITLRRNHFSRWPWEGITYWDYPEKGSLIEMTLRRDHLSRWLWEGITYRDDPEKGSLIIWAADKWSTDSYPGQAWFESRKGNRLLSVRISLVIFSTFRLMLRHLTDLAMIAFQNIVTRQSSSHSTLCCLCTCRRS